MKLADLTVTGFINEVDSKSPAPGGGSVSALASGLGVSLTKMVGHLSVGKKKFKALDENIQNDFNTVIDCFDSIKKELIDLIDKDTEAFNLIMAAFKMPKETPADKAARSAKIEEGTIEAIKVPYRVAEVSFEALKQLDIILEYGNKNTLSDIGVSALMLASGIEGAILNVKINIPGISDEKLKNDYIQNVDSMLEKTKVLRDSYLTQVHNRL